MKFYLMQLSEMHTTQLETNLSRKIMHPDKATLPESEKAATLSSEKARTTSAEAKMVGNLPIFTALLNGFSSRKARGWVRIRLRICTGSLVQRLYFPTTY